MYFVTCPKCGAHLDPGEKCEDCEEKAREQELERRTEIVKFIVEKSGQLRLAF